MKNRKLNILITGAGSGIGKAISIKAGENHNVICLSKSEKAKETSKIIGDNAKYLIADMGDIVSFEKNLKNLLSKIENIDCVVHAAGMIGEAGPVEKTNTKEWLKVFNVNFFSSVLITKLLLPIYKNNNFGKFIYFSGGGSAYGYPVLPQYSTSKTSLVRFVENLEMENKNNNIQSIVIAPGAVRTNMLKDVLKKEEKYGLSAEMRSNTEIDDVVDFIDYLINNDFKNISGKLVHIRDNWKEQITLGNKLPNNLWTLRRLEE